MRKRNVKRFNKEKIMMLASSLLIVAACGLTGYYVSEKEKGDLENQVVDFSVLEDSAKTEAAEDIHAGLDKDLDADPFFAETGGSSVINPDKNKTVSDNNMDMSSVEADEKEQETEETEEEKEQDNQVTQETASQSVVSYAFSESNGMGWPVPGNVVLNYSMDQTVYFSTLSQYKYNPAIIISANEGDTVSACAAGKVTAIGNSEEIGNFLEMDLGNGYKMVLGQLQEISISEGEIVERGQVVGKVAAPTKYYSLEGTNVYLKITKSDIPINPMSLLD
ncbi:MAG: M23 family metallopeptidase [Lachnospiraceae bacterium]|nr:M23 family metallopeptidase [Lachnospiraceae bacterium]